MGGPASGGGQGPSGQAVLCGWRAPALGTALPRVHRWLRGGGGAAMPGKAQRVPRGIWRLARESLSSSPRVVRPPPPFLSGNPNEVIVPREEEFEGKPAPAWTPELLLGFPGSLGRPFQHPDLELEREAAGVTWRKGNRWLRRENFIRIALHLCDPGHGEEPSEARNQTNFPGLRRELGPSQGNRPQFLSVWLTALPGRTGLVSVLGSMPPSST